jgi:hypothetical protein
VASARSLLARVRRIEQARAAPRSPFEAAYGSLEAFEAEVTAGIEAGKYDHTDMPMVLACVRRWHTDGAFGAQINLQVWERGA